MIISPTVSQVLRGVIHEMGGTLKKGLDPVKAAQIDTIISVLGSCAVRVDHQTQFINDEVNSIITLAKRYMKDGKTTAKLKTAMDKTEKADTDFARYEAASHVLSAMSDIGSDAGKDLSEKVFELLEQRLGNEAIIIGGGFEAAGRG